MLLLPHNLAPLARLTCKSIGDDHRYALECVRVEHTAERYTAVATNGRYLGMVQGTADDAESYPTVPALAAAPNGQTAALVSRDDWTRAFRTVPVSRRTSAKPILRNVAVVMGRGVATLGTTDMDAVNVITSNVDANRRYPNAADVLPRGEPTMSVTVDPGLLAELLTVAAQYAADTDQAATLEFREYTDHQGRKRHHPVVVRAANGAQEFTGLLVPLDRDPVAAAPKTPAPRRRKAAPALAGSLRNATAGQVTHGTSPVADTVTTADVPSACHHHYPHRLDAAGWTCSACSAVVS